MLPLIDERGLYVKTFRYFMDVETFIKQSSLCASMIWLKDWASSYNFLDGVGPLRVLTAEVLSTTAIASQ